MSDFASLGVRVLAALVGLSLFAAAVLPSWPVVTVAFFALIAARGGYEASRLLDPGLSRVSAWAHGAACAGAAVAVGTGWTFFPAALFLLLIVHGSLHLLRLGPENSGRGVAGVVGVSLVLVLGMGLLCRHRIEAAGFFPVLVPFFICWMGDTAAYFMGCAAGRHKLLPGVSPNKSWEGFFAGLAGAAVGAVLAGHLGAGLPLWEMALLGLAGGALAAVGDLMESALKRDAGVKDSGRLLPGHGGVLDRFDSVTAVAPLTWIWLVAHGILQEGMNL